MAISSPIGLSPDGRLHALGTDLLSHVPSNVSLTPSQSLGLSHGAFLGVSASESKSHLVFPLGVLRDRRFICCFRFKLWWMTHRVGSCGRNVPLETQFLLVEGKDGSPMSGEMDADSGERTAYTVFLPLLEGPFRASLQGNERDELELCLESGDPAVQTTGGAHSVFVNSGTDPFQVISDAVRTLEMHLETFRHREKKKIPSMLNWFGWCTWDAFYTDVTAEGIKAGLESLIAGGAPPRFLLIDDGWQSVSTDQQPVTASVSNGTGFQSRLNNIRENYKFQKDGKDGHRQGDPELGLKHIVHEAKKQHNVKYIFVWHAITGYWGGVKPGVTGMEHYESALKYPVKSPGIAGNQPADPSEEALELITLNGLGLVHPNKVFHFYDELHSYLAAAGVDGVKVDVQNIIETLGSGFGGRVSITKQYHQALEASIAQNFPDNGCISCMSHNTDGIYSSRQTAVIRASDDFFPKDPSSHTIHIAAVAYNSLFLGEFMQPDWDMFHSNHPAAEYHAAARAVGGCGIYVSDKPGDHDFDLLKKLVLPDGFVLRAQLPGRPSRDCLFTDPTRDGKSLLKIWNMNKHTGVLGVFNCQGAGWCGVEKMNIIHDAEPNIITGSVHARDVDTLANVAGDDWDGDCVIYSHRAGDLVRLPKSSALPVCLKKLEYEVFTVVPVKHVAPGVSFAPIGLLKMFNAGGAIDALEYNERSEAEHANSDRAFLAYDGPNSNQPCLVKMKIRGCGQFGVYSSLHPKKFMVNEESLDFKYDITTGLATVVLPTGYQEDQLWDVLIDL